MEKKVVNFIKNLIAGNNISKQDFLDMYREILDEQIKKRVDRMFKSHNLEITIERLIQSRITAYFQKQIDMNKNYYRDVPDLERVITEEIARQVKEQIRENFKIELLGKEFKVSEPK